MRGRVDTGPSAAILAGDVDGVVRADDPALLVDPERLGDVDEVVQVGDKELGVDQARMRRMRGLNIRTDVLGILVESDGDEDEAVRQEFLVERLPDRQVSATASPRGVSGQDDLLAAMLRERVERAVEVGELEVGGNE